MMTACEVRYEDGKVFIDKIETISANNLDRVYLMRTLYFMNDDDSSYTITMPIDIVVQWPPKKRRYRDKDDCDLCAPKLQVPLDGLNDPNVEGKSHKAKGGKKPVDSAPVFMFDGQNRVDSTPATHTEYASEQDPEKKNQIEKTIRKYRKDVNHCYESIQNETKVAKGKIIITVLVDKTGNPIRVENIQDDFDNKLFPCVRNKVMNWKFGDLDSPVAFKQTWEFQKKSDDSKSDTSNKRKSKRILI